MPGRLGELLALLALDLLNGRISTRSQLAGWLFPEATEANSRRVLNNLLYRLRQELGACAMHVRVTPDSIWLEDAWLDAREVLDAAQSTAIHVAQRELLAEYDYERAQAERACLRAPHARCSPNGTRARSRNS